MGTYSFYQVASSVVQALHPKLAPAPGRACVVPGSQVAWDQCDCDGQLAVTYTQLYPSENFPAELVSDYVGNCGTPYLVGSLVVSVTRCAPSSEENAAPPSCTALDQAAQQQLRDAATVWPVVTCHLEALVAAEAIDAYYSRDLTLIGPQGGCMSLEMRAQVGLALPLRAVG